MPAEECPVCHAWLPVDNAYVTWCEHCGWNVQPLEPARPRTIFEALYASLGRRLSRSLFDEVMRAPALTYALTPSRLLAMVVAGIVHGLTVLCAVFGILLLLTGWPNPFAILGGLSGVAAAVVARPRVPKVPTAAVSRDRLPALYGMVDRIAEALGAPPVDSIVIDWRFNASFTRAGWRRRSVITMGLPLVVVLSGEERVALVAHELAHGVNGDPARSFYIGTAVNTLVAWHKLLRPDRLWSARNTGSVAGSITDLGTVIGNIVSLCLAGVAWSGAYALSHLLWHEAQRAEYRADYLAARVAGTDPMLTMLDKLHLSRQFADTVRSAAVGQASLSIFEELQRRVAEMPGRELERIRRVEQLEATRLDSTHPPTAFRISFIKARRFPEPRVAVSRLDVEQMDSELEPFKGPVQDRLVEMHRASLYY